MVVVARGGGSGGRKRSKLGAEGGKWKEERWEAE